MMTAMFFCMAVLAMVVGHIFKVKRWGLFISVYEEPSESDLLNAMTLGHTLNAILPIRIGDLIRVLRAGRKVRNGYSFALATVLVDLYIDVITVGAMFFGLLLIGKGGERLRKVAQIYMVIFILAVFVVVIGVFFRRCIKKIIRSIAGVFNEGIEFRILYVSYLCIASFKDIVKEIDHTRFLLYTLGTWSGYVASYVIFAEAVQRYGFYYSTSDIFTTLFSEASLYKIETGLMPFWAAYLVLPLFICWILSSYHERKEVAEKPFVLTLPQMNQRDRLAFLKTYYEDEKREHIQAYLTLNRDVTVVEDNSAGSNASTLLVMKPDGNMFFRKYAFGKDGDKLQEQIDWIEDHQFDIPLPVVTEKHKGSNYVTYDMHSYGRTTGLFKYIHTMPVEKSWFILREVLEDIGKRLHVKNLRAADLGSIEKYINTKVNKNISALLADRYIEQLEQYNNIIVNGVSLRTLKHYRNMLDKEHMETVFAHDVYSDIHGDLTVENIVCVADAGEIDGLKYGRRKIPKTYYLIDPNTGNIHDSPFLDYAKLLQSLHGNYEFLMMVTEVAIDKDRVNFFMSKSDAYARTYELYRQYLSEKFSEEEVLSIYYHEAVHWLRLMPYKVRKNEKTAVVFYAGLLSVLNDIWKMEYDGQR